MFFQAYDDRIKAEIKEGAPLEERIRTFELVLQVLDDFLIEDAKSPEDFSIYWKKDGDYHWEISKILDDPEAKRGAIQNAKQSFEAATRWSISEEVDYYHPIKLELAVSFSDFCFQALEKPERAIEIAKAALKDQKAEIDMQTEEFHEKNVAILQRLQERLDVWSPSEQDVEPKIEAEEEQAEEV